MCLRRFALLVLALFVGCSSAKPAPKEATDEELAPKDVPANQTVPTLGEQPAAQPSPGTQPAASTPSAAGSSTPGSSAAGAPTASPKAPSSKAPEDQGPIMTIVYVTEIMVGLRGSPDAYMRPGAIIFSSDPDSIYLQDRPRPSRILKPISPAAMGRLLASLDAAGLGMLHGQELPDADPITGDRQFVFVRDGKKTSYFQSAAKVDAGLFKAFMACDQILIQHAHERNEFVETRGGRDPTPELQPVKDAPTSR